MDIRQRGATRDVGQMEGGDGGRIERVTTVRRKKRVNGRGLEEWRLYKNMLLIKVS